METETQGQVKESRLSIPYQRIKELHHLFWKLVALIEHLLSHALNYLASYTLYKPIILKAHECRVWVLSISVLNTTPLESNKYFLCSGIW